MIDTPVIVSTNVEEAGKFCIRPAAFFDCCRAHQDITAQEGLFVSLLKTERIGFMRDFSRQDLETHFAIRSKRCRGPDNASSPDTAGEHLSELVTVRGTVCDD